MIHLFRIHWMVYVYLLVMSMMGLFIHLFIFILIIFLHECSHYCMARFFGCEVRNISFTIFGGLMEMEDMYSPNIWQDVVITVAGLFSHIVIHFCLLLLTNFFEIDSYVIKLLFIYNLGLFLFNLLPIYPLDGGKLLQYVLQSILPHYYAILVQSYISVVTLSVMTCFAIYYQFIHLQVIAVMAFLFMENLRVMRQLAVIQIRFYLWKMQLTSKQKLRLYYVAHQMNKLSLLRKLYRARETIFIVNQAHQGQTIREKKLLMSVWQDYYLK